MLSGRRLDLLNPSPFDIEIEDVAHGLARVARWNGQTLGDHAFTVAQHSLEVEKLSAKLAPDWPARWKLAALIHDAPEYVIGDMISPFKAALGLDYKTFEARLEAAALSELGENTRDDPGFRVPDVDWMRTGRDVLTLEWIEGTKLSDVAGLIAAGHDLEALAATLVQSFLRHTLRDGFFHADMHPGNLFVDTNGDIVGVDFGITGWRHMSFHEIDR